MELTNEIAFWIVDWGWCSGEPPRFETKQAAMRFAWYLEDSGIACDVRPVYLMKEVEECNI